MRPLWVLLSGLLLVACVHPRSQEGLVVPVAPAASLTEQTAAAPEIKKTPVKIIAVGDIQLGRAWPREQQRLPDNPMQILGKVAPLLAGGDVVFGNLETVLADDGESAKCQRPGKSCFAFRVPTEYAQALKQSGFNLLSNNNNHARDFGEQGLAATHNALSEQALAHSSDVAGVAYQHINGLSIAMVAYATGPEPYRLQQTEKAAALVAELKQQNDLVLVSFHGGAEGKTAQHVPKTIETYYGEDRGDVYAFAHAMVDAGADMILGHGPHVLRGMEIYQGKLIAYSLGNFSAWETFNLQGASGISVILSATVSPEGELLAAKIIPLKVAWPGIPQFDDNEQGIELVNQLSQEDFSQALFTEAGEWNGQQ